MADHARARAVAAVGRTEVESQEQHPIRIAMHEPRHGTVTVFTERVVRFARGPQKLVLGRNDRAAERLLRIVRIEQAHVIRGDADGQHRAPFDQPLALVLGEDQHLFELRLRPDTIARLPAPIVPVFVGNGRKESPPESSCSAGGFGLASECRRRWRWRCGRAQSQARRHSRGGQRR